ncbi:MAG TPA: hypothetical protein PKD52_07330 [Clostridiales bacterium]|nr:hypothetical protein [Clostridiales bacterium]
MNNIALQIERTQAGSVGAGENVVFDSVLYSSGNIDYDPLTGIMTFPTPGRFVLSWNVSTQTSIGSSGVIFGVVLGGDTIISSSPNKTGQVSGTAIVNIETAPASVFLVNHGGGSSFYSTAGPVTASLTVTQDDPGAEIDMQCLAVLQFANILRQMVTAYSSTTWSVFSESLASYSGTPVDVYTSPLASGPGLLRLLSTNGQYLALPIQNITAIYPGDGTMYDPNFEYLPLPDPLPQSCSTDILAAILSYLPVGTPGVGFRLGPSVTASGDIYRNEYGVVVLSDEEGNTPIFLPTPKILLIQTADDPSVVQRTGSAPTKHNKPHIEVLPD